MYNIRKAILQDVVEIAQVHVACWSECYPFLPTEMHAQRSAHFRERQWKRELCGESESLTLVLCDGARVVGFGHVKPNEDQDMPEADFELHACYFLPSYRRTSAGPAMMTEMLDFVSASGSGAFCVWVWKDNPLRLTYAALGMRSEVKRNRCIGGFCAPEIGYIGRDISQTKSKLSSMTNSLARRNAEVENQLYSPILNRQNDLRSDRAQ